MRRALEMFVVEGIYTTIPLHQKIMNDPDFIAGKDGHKLSLAVRHAIIASQARDARDARARRRLPARTSGRGGFPADR